uniref:Zinc finger protein ush-like n=2 Tax=Hirondellea gigas TaxID=1518452 RepID=A0A6A7FX86_9CRUS
MLLCETEVQTQRLGMDSQSCDWILQCLKNNMDKAEATQSNSAEGSDKSAETQHSPRSRNSSSPCDQATRDSSESPDIVESEKASHSQGPPGSPTPSPCPSPNSTAATSHSYLKAALKNCTAGTSIIGHPSPSGLASTSASECSSKITPSGQQLTQDKKSHSKQANTKEPGNVRQSSEKETAKLNATTVEKSSLSQNSKKDIVCPPTMKQERGASPPADAAINFSKALSLASSSSAIANAVLSLSQLSSLTNSSALIAGGAGTPASDLVKQHICSMLQGLPFLLPGLQRLVPPVGGMSLNNNNNNSSSGTAAGGSGGIMCACGIRFTCRSNMEAHKKFYCTHQSNSASVDGDGSNSNREDVGEDGNWGGVYRCPQCPFTAQTKLSLNGHMNIHTSTPEEVPSLTPPKVKTPASSVDPRAAERYCTECDIQFSSLKTFKVHKAHYCQTRHVLKANKSPLREEPLVNSSLINSSSAGQPILLLPTDPVLLVPYSVIIGASLLPSHVLPQQGAAVLTPDGQIQPLSLAHALGNHTPAGASSLLSHRFNLPSSISLPTSSANVSPQVSPRASNSVESSAPKIFKEELRSTACEPTVSGKRRGDNECPLDLTTKRSKLSIKSDLLSDEEKENREVNTPSLSNSPAVARNGSSAGSISGEFEGKLLASPRTSPTGDAGDRSTPRSPRPGSAAPSLTSPRTASQESPRASTSAANQSPSQSSPTLHQSLLPQIPAGFSNILGGIDNLSGLPFSSLQYLQGFQGATPELLLKMFNGIVPPLPAPPPPPPSTTPVKQGEARCNECNIIFYKEENYLVHKKHYCAARDKSNDEERQSAGRHSPASARGSLSPPNRTVKPELLPASNISLRDVPKTSKPTGQFACNPCGIKFTSPDNLAAHQTYYCPKREGSTSEEGVTKGMWRCPRCRVAMPETLQAAHQCVSPGTSSAHGWKCPCCPMLSPTATAAQKHLETHAGIKAFRCTICGYRGNTLRGMRTHIRMHFEKRTNDLQEENFIECILEDDDRRYRMNSAQEIRMNITEHQQALLENPALAAAILSNSGTSISENTDPPMSCTICPFVTTNRRNFIKHLAIAHKLGVELKNILENQPSPPALKTCTGKPDTNENAIQDSNISPPLSAIKLEPEIKLEVADSEEETQMSSSPSKSPIASEENGTRASASPPRSSVSPPAMASTSSRTSNTVPTEPVHHCHVCNISFSFIDSYLAHKRYYCNRQQSNTPPETTVQ